MTGFMINSLEVEITELHYIILKNNKILFNII
jgi:hypothetical protein